MEMPKPRQEHQWLQRLVGEWTIESEGTTGPDQPPVTWQGSEIVRAIGDYWIVSESQGAMPEGGVMTTILTLGYDMRKERFVSTFIASAMPELWVYDGALDAAGRVLTLEAGVPHMLEAGKMTRYQDVLEIIDDDHRVVTSRVLGDDGQWYPFMTAQYRRKR